jgi:hypothetical protein
MTDRIKNDLIVVRNLNYRMEKLRDKRDLKIVKIMKKHSITFAELEDCYKQLQ